MSDRVIETVMSAKVGDLIILPSLIGALEEPVEAEVLPREIPEETWLRMRWHGVVIGEVVLKHPDAKPKTSKKKAVKKKAAISTGNKEGA